jgi:acyl-CoA thioester hydrolase
MKSFTKSFKVYFGDTDAAGVVYHGNYIYWLEAARIDFLDYIGCSYKSLQESNIGLMPVDISIQYLKPLKFSDEFIVEVQLHQLTKASISIKSKFIHNSEVINTSIVKLVCINEKTWKPRKIPVVLLDSFKSL